MNATQLIVAIFFTLLVAAWVLGAILQDNKTQQHKLTDERESGEIDEFNQGVW